MPTSFSTKAAFLCIFNTLLSILLLAISCVFAQVQYDPSHCALSSDFAACIVPPPDTDGDVACLQSLTDAITEYQLRSNDAPGTALYLQRNLTITRQVNFETTTLEVIVFGCGHVVTCEGKVGSDGRPRQTGINIYGGISNTMGQNSFAETGGVQFADLTLTGCNKGIWVLLPTSASLTLLENVHITKCSQSTGGNGGAVYTVGKLTVLNSTFDLNEARDQGGALYSKNHMTVVNSVFQENAAGGRGGACFSEGVMEVDNSTFEHNVAQLGGAIYGKDVSMVARSRFEFNVAGQDQGLNNDVHSGSGGAIFGYGDGDIQNCTFMNNTASRYGGALRYLGNLSVNDTGFFNNTISFVTNDLDVLGGAIRVFWSLIVIGSTFIDNSVRDDGGAVFCENRVYAQDCQFLNNVAGQSGGAIRARFVETVGGTFDNNTARDGGAMYSTKVVELQATSFSHNVATTAGGAVFLGDGGHLEACTFKANIASIGAAVNSIGLKLTVRNSVMKQNSAPQQGFVTAIMNHGQGTLELTNTSILDNTAFDIGLVNSIDLLMVDCLVSGNVVTGNGPHISASHYVRAIGSVIENNNVSAGGVIGTSSRVSSAFEGAGGGMPVLQLHEWGTEGIESAVAVAAAETEGHTPVESTAALYVVNLIDCHFHNNINLSGGCGVFNSNGSVFIEKCAFSQNYALLGEGGGGCGGVVMVADTTFTENYARDGGGGFLAIKEASVVNTSFECNFVDTVGAGFKLRGTKFSIEDSTFENNIGSVPRDANCWDFEAGKGVICISRYLQDRSDKRSYSRYAPCKKCAYVMSRCQLDGESSPYSACVDDDSEPGGFQCACDLPEAVDGSTTTYYTQALTGRCAKCSECGEGEVVRPCRSTQDTICKCSAGKTGNLCIQDCQTPANCFRTVGETSNCDFSSDDFSLGIQCDECEQEYYINSETNDCTKCTTCGTVGRVTIPCGRYNDTVCQCPLGITGPGCEVSCQPPVGCALVDPNSLNQCVFDTSRYDLNVKCTSCIDKYFLATLPLVQHSLPDPDDPLFSLQASVEDGETYTTCKKWRDCEADDLMLYQRGTSLNDSVCGTPTAVSLRLRSPAESSGNSFANQVYLQMTQTPNTYRFIVFDRMNAAKTKVRLLMARQLADQMTLEADTYGPTLLRSMDIQYAQIQPEGDEVEYEDGIASIPVDPATDTALSSAAIAGISLASIGCLLLLMFLLGRWYVRRVAAKYQTPSAAATERNIRRKHRWTDAGTDEARQVLRQLREMNVGSDGWISPQSFKTLDLIGTGAFGKIYRGVVFIEDTAVVCAIKCLKESDVTQMAAFEHEIQLQQNLNHPNLVHVLGASIGLECDHETGVRPLYLLMEYCQEKDLHTYLTNNAAHVTIEMKLWYAYELAKAMAYLADVGVIHRDVAARNCLLSAQVAESFGHFNVKLSDMGMARAANNSGQYIKGTHGGLLPVRWMAIESIENDIYTSQSDVWAFAVTVWEIFSNGAVPYGFLPEATQVRQALRHGVKLLKPTGMPPETYESIQDCWHENPGDRPDIHIVAQQIYTVFRRVRDKNNKDGELDKRGKGELCATPRVLPGSIVVSVSRNNASDATSMEESRDECLVPESLGGSGMYENVDDALFEDLVEQQQYRDAPHRLISRTSGTSEHSETSTTPLNFASASPSGRRRGSGGGLLAHPGSTLSPYENDDDRQEPGHLDTPASDIQLLDDTYRHGTAGRGRTTVHEPLNAHRI